LRLVAKVTLLLSGYSYICLTKLELTFRVETSNKWAYVTQIKTLKGYRLDSLDGEIGRVKEFYFDDLYWTIRYLVADSGNWLSDRLVLISPHALFAVNKEEQNIAINLTKKQIEDSPPLKSDKPVSQQYEKAYYVYYGWPTYWMGAYPWGLIPTSCMIAVSFLGRRLRKSGIPICAALTS
jgi:hypothetical protein